jgi:putative transposase
MAAFLRAENQVLKSRLRRQIRTTPQERARPVRLGKPLGAALDSLISIVSPKTFVRWVHRLDREPRGTPRRKKRGSRQTRTAAGTRGWRRRGRRRCSCRGGPERSTRTR